MSHHKETHPCRCAKCKGTGLYVGVAERDGAAVVCYACKGTGASVITIEWDDFEGRRPRAGVTHVYGANPGIVAAPDVVPGGVSHRVWEADATAPHRRGAEMRAHTCPAWWYQTADYAKKPDWKECGWGCFSYCKFFPKKGACWARFDAEAEKGGEQ